MKNQKTIYEQPLIYLIIFIVGFGIVMMSSASSYVYNDYSYFLTKHIFRIAISLIAFLIVYNIDFKYLKIYSGHILFISWFILIAGYLFNEGSSTRRFLIIFGKNIFTTSDFAKIALIIYTANFIENNNQRINDLSILIKEYAPYAIFTLGLILFQPDLSTTFIITLIIITMLIIGGLSVKYILIPGLVLLLPIIFTILNTPYQKTRFLNWFYGDLNYQTKHSLEALGNGGFFGTGIGNSIIKNGYMPEVHTDFILPIIGEELGFIGIFIIFNTFSLIYYFGIKICKSAPDIFSSMLSLGIITNILYYFLINASYVVGITPTTGLPIPFISYGGSHTLFCFITIAILMNISKYTNIYKYKSL